MEAELKEHYEQAEILLIPGAGGAFEIETDEKVIFSKFKRKRFPEEGEIIRLLQEAGY